MGLFLQIVVFLIVAAALGFAVGWLLRGSRLEEESAASSDWQTRLSGAESERDRLRGELAAATEDRAAIERARREAEERAATGDPELKARATRLERELEEARAGSAGQRAAIERARREAEERAAAGDPELKARATRLERELEEVRAGSADQRAEIERLQARLVELQTKPAERPATAPLAAMSAAPQAVGRPASDATAAGSAPAGLPGPEGKPDDLKLISGIGPGIEKTLHELGVFHFRQIAAFTPENVAWVNRRLRFKGRIEREDWIGQARTLAAGGETEFSQRQQARHS